MGREREKRSRDCLSKKGTRIFVESREVSDLAKTKLWTLQRIEQNRGKAELTKKECRPKS